MANYPPDRESTFDHEVDYLCNMAASGLRLDRPSLSGPIFSIARGLGQSGCPEKKFSSDSRIALIIPYHPLEETGGLEIGTRMIAQGLSQLGHRVEIISRGQYPDHDRSGNIETPEGIMVHGVGKGIEDINQYIFQNLGSNDVFQWMEIFPPVPEEPTNYNDKAEQQYLASVLLRAAGKRTYLYVATSGNVAKRGTNNPDWTGIRKSTPAG